MSRSFTATKEQLLEICSAPKFPVEPFTLSAIDDKSEFSLSCCFRVIRVGNQARLMSRIHYYITADRSVMAKDALYYAEKLNRLLAHSQIFVVQDIDGDRRYGLQMDTLLNAPADPAQLAQFLDNIAADVERLLQYFRDQTT